MLFLPIARGAAVMLCDDACLGTVADRLPAVEPQTFDVAEACVTCFACGLTIPAIRCLCAETGTSCSLPSWLLTIQPHAAIDAIYAACGPILLSDTDWEFLLARAEEVDVGGLVGLLWVRERRLKRDPDQGCAAMSTWAPRALRRSSVGYACQDHFVSGPPRPVR